MELGNSAGSWSGRGTELRVRMVRQARKVQKRAATQVIRRLVSGQCPADSYGRWKRPDAVIAGLPRSPVCEQSHDRDAMNRKSCNQ